MVNGIYNRAVLNRLFVVFAAAALAAAQNPPAPSAAPGQPPVRVNVVNVCNPPAEEQKDLAATLARLPAKPAFAADFEIARGRSTGSERAVSNWVRVRREFGAQSAFTSVQYSFTTDATNTFESLVFRPRDTSELVQVVLEVKVTAGSPAAVLAADTPVTRVRIERLGKPSRGIARCAEVDQAAYAPIFATASEVVARYRTAMRLRQLVPAELARLGVGTVAKAAAKK